MTTYEWDAMDPISAGDCVNARTPRTFPIGAFTIDDFGPGSAGVFLWFGSSAEMLTFLATQGLALSDTSEEDVAAFRQLVQMHVEDATETLRESLNAVTAGTCRIDWWGRYDHLLTSDEEFAQSLRIQFRDVTDDGSGTEDASHIAEADNEAFLDFLEEYVVS